MVDDALAFIVHKVTSCGEAAVTVRPYPVVCPTVELGLLVQLPRRKCPIFPLAEPAMHDASSLELFFLSKRPSCYWAGRRKNGAAC